jgi:hypothetical protein
VAITRAKGVFWMIGGEMKKKHRWESDPLHLITQYKRELDAANQVHRFTASRT